MNNRIQLSALCFLLCCLTVDSVAADKNIEFQIDEKPIATDVPRLGINLGESVAWGASQFTANILNNPGFEGIIDRAIVIVKSADTHGFLDDTDWLARPNGFWAGAKFDVRSGSQASTQGVLSDSVAVGRDGLPEFIVQGSAPALAAGDVVSLTRINDDALPDQWWFSKDPLAGQLAVDKEDKRPNSSGKRSLAIKPSKDKAVEVISYLDSIGDRAGKLLPVNGNWRLGFWLKESESGAKVSVKFQRLNGKNTVFFQESFKPTKDWTFIERTFKAEDSGAPGTLELKIKVEGDNGRVLLDDIELGAVVENNATVFRPEVISALKKLQPGYLRDWQGQLGDTFDNRLADVFARRSSRYRPGDGSAFNYSLNEFFQLAQTVGSQPWIILPTTLNDEELGNLGKYLVKQIEAFHFKELLVEFGNENWNGIFRPAGISDYKTHGEAATRAFQKLLAGANNHAAIRTIVNGQYVNPSAALNMLDATPNAQALAVAPYFLFELNKSEDAPTALFNQDDYLSEEVNEVQKRAKELMVYEVNLHTTRGDVGVDERNSVVTGLMSGSALAKRLLTALNLGVKRQCIYELSQYDTFLEQQGKRDLVKLWGVMRDLGATQRFRPTGLAMMMLNQALPGDVYPVKTLDNTPDKEITLTAFHNKKSWAIAAISAKANKQKITVNYPAQKQKLTWRVLHLKGASPLSNNENAEDVRIVEEQITSEDNKVSLTLQPFEFVLLVQNENK